MMSSSFRGSRDLERSTTMQEIVVRSLSTGDPPLGERVVTPSCWGPTARCEKAAWTEPANGSADCEQRATRRGSGFAELPAGLFELLLLDAVEGGRKDVLGSDTAGLREVDGAFERLFGGLEAVLCAVAVV